MKSVTTTTKTKSAIVRTKLKIIDTVDVDVFA